MQKLKRKKHFSWWKKAAKETKEVVAEEVSPGDVISAANLVEQIGAGIEHVHPPVDIADSLLPDGVDMAFSLVSAILGSAKVLGPVGIRAYYRSQQQKKLKADQATQALQEKQEHE
jgi:hypothetical protein